MPRSRKPSLAVENLTEEQRQILRESAAIRSAMRTKEAKTCPICHEPFMGIKRQVYCSEKCASRAHARTNRPRRRKDGTIREPGEIVSRICPQCGKETIGQKSTAVFCSRECKDRYRNMWLTKHKRSSQQPLKSGQVTLADLAAKEAERLENEQMEKLIGKLPVDVAEQVRREILSQREKEEEENLL